MKVTKYFATGLSYDQFNAKVQSLLDRDMIPIVRFDWKLPEHITLQDEFYVYTVGKSFVYLFYKENKSYKRFKTRLDEKVSAEVANLDGGDAFKKLYYSLKTQEDKDWVNKYKNDENYIEESDGFIAVPYTYYNRDFDETRFKHCISYDRNSAYAAAMLEPMPYGDDLGDGEVEEGQIGFIVEHQRMRAGYGLLLPGEGYADHRYKVKESPFKEFALNYYQQKKNAKTPDSKKVAKNILTWSVGNLKHHNYVIWNAILGYSGRYIRHFVEKYIDCVLYSNTDSLVCTQSIPEIESLLGTDLGQFKIEHEGDFAYKQTSYQWNVGTPDMTMSYRGISKKSFSEDFDILTDKVPKVFYTILTIEKETGLLYEKQLSE